MPRISTDNYDTVASWNGSQDLFVVEQPDGTKVATPAMVKQYVLNNMDEVPTQDSNKPVKSGGIFNSEDDIWKANGMLGAKNLYNSQYSAPRTNAETTATLGDDGHVIMNGTANADAAQLNRPGKTIKPINGLKVGDKLILSYKVISGTFTHGSSNRNTTLYFNNKNNSAVDPIIFPLSLSAGDSDSKEIALTNECFTDGILDLKDIQIYMRSGDTFNNLELAIMLRLASDTDNTYQSYVKTNRQLTEEIGDLSQTGLTGDSVADQLSSAKTYVDDAVNSSKSSLNNITISRMGKVRVLTFNRAVYSDIKTFFANLDSSDKPSALQFSTVMRTSPDDKYMTLAFVYASASGGLFIRHFAQYNANSIEGQIGETDKAIGELVYIVD